MTSDHSPLIVTYNNKHTDLRKEKNSIPTQQKTNWILFREIINEQITCNILLKTAEDLEITIDNFNTTIQNAA